MVYFLRVLLVLGMWSQSAFAERVLVDRVVAVVNGEIILHSDIQKKIDGKVPVSISSFPATRDDPIFEQSLQDSINFLLINQEAEKMNIDFDDAEVEESIKKIYESRGQSLGFLQEQLRLQGVSYKEYKEFYRKSMIAQRFQQAMIFPLIKITDKDLETFYMKKTGQKSSNMKLTISQILIQVPSDAASEIAEGKKKLANKVYRDLQGGLEFGEAVKIYSDDVEGRKTEGKMGTVNLKDLAAPIQKAVEGLQQGEFTRPVELGGSFYIFKLDDKQFSGSDDFAGSKAKLENELRMVQADTQTQKWLDQRRQRSEVKVLR